MLNIVKFSYGLKGAIIYCLVNSLVAIFQLLSSVWIGFWISKDLDSEYHYLYPLIMGGIIGFFFFFTFSRLFVIVNTLLNASNEIHRKMIGSILRAKTSFFDENSIGKIMTRFSKDITVFDNILPLRFSIYTVGIFRILSVTVILVVINAWLLIPIAIFSTCIIAFSRKIEPFMLYIKEREIKSKNPIN